MKKCLSVLLAVLMLFSMASILAFADDETTTYEITFIAYDEEGEELMHEVVTTAAGARPLAPRNPVRPNGADGTEYTFRGWMRADDTAEEPEVYSPYLLPEASENVTYKAVFEVTKEGKDSSDTISLFGFLTSIFSRLNKIYARLIYIFKYMTKWLNKSSNFVKKYS